MAWIFLVFFFVLFFDNFFKYTNNERLFTAIYVQCMHSSKYDVRMGSTMRMVRANDECG